MSIPESTIVSVTLSIEQQATSEQGFGLTCIFGKSAILPLASRYGLYPNLDAVGEVFTTDTPEYQAAEVYFAANESNTVPAQVMIARMFDTAVAAELLGSAGISTTIEQFSAIANGAISLHIDGTALNVASIDLSEVTTMAGVATAVQTALATAKAGTTCTWNGSQFMIQSPTTGTASALTFPTVAPAGTDLAPLMKLRQVDGALLSQGQAAETVTQSLQNVKNLFGDWYMFALCYSPSNQDVQDAAAFALAQSLICGNTTPDPNVWLQSSTTDIASVLKASTNRRVMTVADKQAQNPFAVLGAFAQAAQIDFNGIDTTETLMFKQLPGVSVSNFSLTELDVLKSKNCNYYISVGGNPMFAQGQMADGSWFDQVQGLDWFAAAVQNAAFGTFYRNPKVAQTDRGVATLVHDIQSPCDQAVTNGLIAPGKWNGAPIGNVLKTGQTLNKGYMIIAGSVDDQTQSDREARIAPPITIVAKGAGALQGANIVLRFEQ
jgi:hypothetical protein